MAQINHPVGTETRRPKVLQGTKIGQIVANGTLRVPSDWIERYVYRDVTKYSIQYFRLRGFIRGH